MNDASEAYEKIVRLTAPWQKGGGKLPLPFPSWSATDSTRDELSRLGSATLRNNRKLTVSGFKGEGTNCPSPSDAELPNSPIWKREWRGI